MFADPFESVLDIAERIATPVLVDRVCETLAIACRSSDVGSNNDEALLSKHSRVPSRRPTITPSTLWTAMDEVRHRILLRIVEVARPDDPRVDLLCHLWVAGRCPDR